MGSKEELKKSDPDFPSNTSSICWYIRSDDNKILKRNKSAIPCGRWGHASTSIDNALYVYGGAGDKISPHYWDSPYKLDLETWEWVKVEAANKAPGLRDSHSVNIYKDKLYVFGGSCDNDSRNDLYEFDLNTNLWKAVEVKGSIPPPREGHSACLYEDRYLVVYGGWNGKETLSDLYILDMSQMTWMAVEKTTGKEPASRESHSCNLIRDAMYVFGGQGNSAVKDGENVELFYNDLYKLKISIENSSVSVTWEKLEPESSIPDHRSSHSGSVYKDRYLFIIGGEGYSQADYQNKGDAGAKPAARKPEEGEGEFSCFPKNDIWYYDIEINQWFCLKIKNDPEFAPRFAHSCNSYKDYQIVFGGMRDYNHSTSDICILSFDGINPFANAKVSTKPRREQKSITQEADKAKVSSASKSIKEKSAGEFNAITPTHHGGGVIEPVKEPSTETLTELDGPLVSTSFLHSLSSLISWPLAAFGLLLDNAVINKASNMKIEVLNTKRKNPEAMVIEESKKNESEITYLIIEDDGKGWKHNDFIHIFMKYDTDSQEANSMPIEDADANPQEEERKRRLNEYSFNLKVAGFRLGKTLIYISKTEEEMSLGFMSVDKRYNPDIHDNHVFLYSWKTNTQEYLTSQAQKNKDIIMNALAGVFTEEDLLYNMEKVSNRLYVLDLTPVAVSKSANAKNQDYELKFLKKAGKVYDIAVRTLDKTLNNFYTDQQNMIVELSLRTYFSHFFLDPTQANIEIFINDVAIPLANVKDTVESREGQANLVKLKEEGLYEGYVLEGESQKASKEKQDNSKRN